MTIELYKNTFVTLEEAQNYFDERFNSDVWSDLDTDVQEKLLVSASKKVSRFDFVGKPLSVEQPMAFPRNFDMPQDIKDAVCEESISMLETKDDVHLQNQNDNISSISLGAGSVSYNKTLADACEQELVSKTAEFLVKKWTKRGYNLPC